MNPSLKFLILAALLVIFFSPTSVNTQCLSRNAIKARGESWVGKVPYITDYSMVIAQTVQVLFPCAGLYQNQEQLPLPYKTMQL